MLTYKPIIGSSVVKSMIERAMVIAESLRYLTIFKGRDAIESKRLIKLGLADTILQMEEIGVGRKSLRVAENLSTTGIEAWVIFDVSRARLLCLHTTPYVTVPIP